MDRSLAAGDQIDPTRATSATTRAALRAAALFALSFIVVGAVVRVASPPRPGHVWHPTFTAKIDHLRETTEHYDIVFVGNSQTYLLIDPFAVEASMAAQGCEASVYNLGSVAQTKFEFDHMMQTLADTPGGTPEWVVSVDRSLFEIGLVRDFSVRHRVFMDVGNYRDAVDYIANLPDDTGLKSQAKVIDLSLGFAVNQIPVGAGHQRLFTQPALEEEEAMVSRVAGLHAVVRSSRSTRGPDEVAALRQTVADDVASGAWAAAGSTRNRPQEALDRWVSTIEAHVSKVPEGARAAHVLVPADFDRLTARRIAEAWASSGSDVPLIDLLADDDVGDFTDPALWSDRIHMNAEGAQTHQRRARDPHVLADAGRRRRSGGAEMLFTQPVFFVFALIVLGLHWWVLRTNRSRKYLLLVASYVFYGWWDPRFLSLIVLSTLIDYVAALRIEAAGTLAGATSAG